MADSIAKLKWKTVNRTITTCINIGFQRRKAEQKQHEQREDEMLNLQAS